MPLAVITHILFNEAAPNADSGKYLTSYMLIFLFRFLIYGKALVFGPLMTTEHDSGWIARGIETNFLIMHCRGDLYGSASGALVLAGAEKGSKSRETGLALDAQRCKMGWGFFVFASVSSGWVWKRGQQKNGDPKNTRRGQRRLAWRFGNDTRGNWLCCETRFIYLFYVILAVAIIWA